NNNASPTVTSCTFSGNTADYNGGGMYNNNASPTVTSCTFSGNTANNGGGMFNLNASPTVTSCTFSDNSASFSGGGMFNYHASPTVTSCILWGNSAIDGAQIYDVSSSSPTVSYSIVQGGYDGNLGDDPQLDSELRIVSTDSPAIDAGNGCVAPVIDKDGLGRVDIASKGNTGLGPAVDIGAYEYQGGAGDTPAPAPSPDTCCTIDSDASLPHDYYYCDFSPLSWEAAKAYCENSGIHLASIGGEIEQTVVSELVGTNYAFIGATDAATEDMWLWSDGTSFDYTNWAVADSEPNGSTSANCMAIDGSRSGQWDDTTCSNLLAFVCESAD
ncbi:MAG TPA: C-type lectin domain-containing protein, partial [candidate division Zixibacteria bacterium]|nr:C-type lectin domain-containing protein [candidate division Zixibacteria bacterium]